MLGYGVAAHWAMATGQTRPALALLLILLLTSAIAAFRRNEPHFGLAWLAGATGVAWLSISSRAIDAIYLPPIVITSLLFWAFARSLSPGRAPLVTVFATLIDGELDAATMHYTRRATLWWAVFLACLLIETVLLALFAAREVWSAFSHFINYVLIAAFFFIEFRLRRHYLPHRSTAGFLAFMKSLPRVYMRAVRQVL